MSWQLPEHVRMNEPVSAGASGLQAVNHGVLPEADIAGQAVGYCKVELSVGCEYCGIGATGCREFFDHHQLSLLPLIDTRGEIGLRRSRRTVNEIDFADQESLRRLHHGKLHSAGPAQRLMRHEPTGVPAIEKGFAGQIGEGEPGLAIHAEKFVCTPALRCEFLERRERLSIPDHQAGGAGVIRISQEMLPVDVEINPVITPPSVQGLKVDEFISIPFKYARASSVPRHRAVDGHALRQRQKMAIADGEIMPLLGRKGWKPLKDLPPCARAPVENGVDIEIVRAGAGSNAGGREKFVAADLEEVRVFSARDRQSPVLDEPAAGPAVEQHVDVAVAAVPTGRMAGNVDRELGNP